MEDFMGSDFQQVARFSHLQIQNLNEFEYASLKGSVKGLLLATKGNNFLGLSLLGKLVSRELSTLGCTCPLKGILG